MIRIVLHFYYNDKILPIFKKIMAILFFRFLLFCQFYNFNIFGFHAKLNDDVKNVICSCYGSFAIWYPLLQELISVSFIGSFDKFKNSSWPGSGNFHGKMVRSINICFIDRGSTIKNK